MTKLSVKIWPPAVFIMSKLCRICTKEMPKDRKGWHQVCGECRRKGHRELVMTNEGLFEEKDTG